MANITRFDPFNELVRFDPLADFDNFLKGISLRPVLQNGSNMPQMKLEVAEDEKTYTVKADLPGVKKEDIRLAVDGNQVSISAEMKKESEQKEGETIVHSERYYGRVSRSFTLDNEVQQDSAQAKYADGVLEVVLPKKKGAKSKQVAIA